MPEHPMPDSSADGVSADGAAADRAPTDRGTAKNSARKSSEKQKKKSRTPKPPPAPDGNGEATKAGPPPSSKTKKRKATPPPAPPGSKKSTEGPPPKSPKNPGESVEVESTEIERPFSFARAVPGWAVSMVAHMLLIIVMALWEIAAATGGGLAPLSVVDSKEDAEQLEQLEDPEELKTLDKEMPQMPQMQMSQVEQVEDKITSVQVNEQVGTQQVKVKLNFTDRVAPKSSIMKKIGAFAKGLSGRSSFRKRELLRKYGGNDASEQAVAAALRWLANHQRRDGGWSFNHRTIKCGRFCTHPGSMRRSRNGATALALLPFLGAGQTHKQGKYKEVVGRGLLFLARNMKTQNLMGSLVDKDGGMMYSHGLAAIALCEAYAMTKDRELRNLAQLSLNFTMFAQDPVGGGWRYIPRERGDTSAVGWQLMALKSGHMADLQVNPLCFKKAWFFLNTVGRKGGSEYGYMTPVDGGAGTTAVGLLSRMYLGWQKENPILKQGVTYLSNVGPTRNMYYNYYATQVMRHYEGPMWEKWNKENRDALIKLQNKNGHAHGSWDCCSGDDHGNKSGGRLYCTAFAAMILEVYYRHMPLYGKDASDDDFKF